MERCLGIYIGDKIIKYAKLRSDKNKHVDVEAYGTKFVIGDKKQVIDEIINETNSQNTPISINLVDEKYSKLGIIKQISRSDINNIIELEIEDLANKEGINDKIIVHKYIMTDSEKNKDEDIANIVYVDKNNIEQYLKMEGADIKGTFPLPYIVSNLVTNEVKNYMLVSMEEDTYITTVVGGKQQELKNMNIGMKDIIEKLSEQLGSYVKAYESCKAINVYTEDENPNNPEIEKIVEPVLQDMLHRIETELNNVRGKVDKIYITGMGVLFTNIDMLFEQYFGVPTEILKPEFARDGSGIRNIAELVEVNSAISLAYELISDSSKEMNFMLEIDKKMKNDVKNGKVGKFNLKMPEVKVFANTDVSDVYNKLTIATVITAMVLVVYAIFGIVYNFQVDNMEKNMQSKTTKIEEQMALVNSDIKYINDNTAKYKTVNDLVTSTIDKIEGREIGVLSTYNVANFMQKIMKFIPKGVELVTVSSDDNKKVTITAKSTSYADLGYFVSQLKLEGILNGVVVDKVTHGTDITVSISGDLP